MAQQGQWIFKSDQRVDFDPHEEVEPDLDEAGSAPPDAARLSDLQLEVALYVESISAELRLMARAADLEALSYFLEMARIEASIQIERRALPLPERPRT